MKFRLITSRLTWPVFFVVMMLQRSPVIRYLADIELSLIPRVQHLWTIAVGAVTVGAYNSVTAASGDLQFKAGEDDTTVTIGEALRLIIEVDGSKLLIPGTWIVPDPDELPAGVTASANYGAGLVTISGTPTEAGSFPVEIQAWQRSGMRGDEGTPLSFTIIVDPLISEQPSAVSADWNAPAVLSVVMQDPEGVTYQWQKQNAENPEMYDDLPGQTGAALSLTNARSNDSGNYQVLATKGAVIEVSLVALLTVNFTPFQAWLDIHFEDPFVAEAGEEQNNDSDNFINLVESLFGGDPMVADSFQFPEVSQEVIGEIRYAVFRYPAVPEGTESQITPEATADLVGNLWTPLQNGVEGVIIESTAEGYFVKMPADVRQYLRLIIASAL